MHDQTTSRVIREQNSYNEGTVLSQSIELHNRFWHVFCCPNTRFGEDYMEAQIRARADQACALDYGCGNGRFSQLLLSAGARRVIGIDISPRNVAEAEQACHLEAGAKGRAEFHVMDAHNVDFQDEFFDLVVGGAILHHLEFERAVYGISRVLKKGGYAIFAEPLRGNPVSTVYRLLTPGAHTQDELALSRGQVEWANTLFESHQHVFCGFASTALGLVTSLVSKQPENVWLRLADSIDRTVMRTPLRYWMRYAYLVWKK